MQYKIINITQTDPHICLQERVTQNMPKIPLYSREKKLHWFILIAWRIWQKRCRRVGKSQNVCPQVFSVYISENTTWTCGLEETILDRKEYNLSLYRRNSSIKKILS